jgi:ABC-type Fe3+ transport system permease subunit
VFFLVFFNAAAGASSVPAEMIQNAQLLGASKLGAMWKVRWPIALEWTLASLPNAIAFGLTGTITAQLFIGGKGLGYLLLLSIDNSNATLLFSIVVVVAVVGVVLVLGSARLGLPPQAAHALVAEQRGGLAKDIHYPRSTDGDCHHQSDNRADRTGVRVSRRRGS